MGNVTAAIPTYGAFSDAFYATKVVKRMYVTLLVYTY